MLFDQFFSFSTFPPFSFDQSTANGPQMKKTTKRIENIKKKITNDENEIKNQKIKMKFHATDEISKHDDLIKHEDFFLIFKVVPMSRQSEIQSYDL